MKTFFTCMALAWPLHQAAAQQQCPPITDPNPFIESTNIAGMERYLARSIFMSTLADQNTQFPSSWSDSTNAPRACENTPFVYYCPERYRQNVDMLADINAGFILAAAGRWGNELSLSTLPNPDNHSDYLAAAARLVTDVNNAYDCKGLRRPIIQAAIFEHISVDRDSNHQIFDSQLRHVTIPTRVIQAFEDEMTSQNKSTYFDTSVFPNIPRTDVKFTLANAAFVSAPGNPNPTEYTDDFISPDYNKIEGRMWIYHQATLYIDMGYRALHMGQVSLWGRLAWFASQANSEEVKREKIITMLNLIQNGMNKIRLYAAQHSSFVVLNAEAASNDFQYGYTDSHGAAKNYYYGNYADRNLIFDYKTVPMRPMELFSAQQMADDRGLCQSNANNSLTMFNNTACGTLKMASIDPCNGSGRGQEQTSNYGSDGGGHTSLGQDYGAPLGQENGSYETLYQTPYQTPYQIGFDFGGGLADYRYWPNTAPGEYYPGREGCWGYDDARWFASQLRPNPTCQAVWFPSQLQTARRLTASKSFFTVPGWLPGIPAYTASTLYSYPASVGTRDYNLIDNPTIPNTNSNNAPAIASIKQSWQVTAPNVNKVVEAQGGGYAGTCRIGKGEVYERYFPRIYLTVTNPDVTSIYTWHVCRPDGTWMPITRKDVLDLSCTMPGTYKIGLRQDNLGLPSQNYGSKSFDFSTPSQSTCSFKQENPTASAERLQLNEMSKTDELAMVRSSMLYGKAMPAAAKVGFGVDVAPNPTVSSVSVAVKTGHKGTIAITAFNTLNQQIGKSVSKYSESGSELFTYDLSTLPQGIYFLQVSQNGQQKTAKVIKQ